MPSEPSEAEGFAEGTTERNALKAKHLQLQKKVRMLGQRLSRTQDVLSRTRKEITFLLMKQAQLDATLQHRPALKALEPFVTTGSVMESSAFQA
jgi:hypothetical protein